MVVGRGGGGGGREQAPKDRLPRPADAQEPTRPRRPILFPPPPRARAVILMIPVPVDVNINIISIATEQSARHVRGQALVDEDRCEEVDGEREDGRPEERRGAEARRFGVECLFGCGRGGRGGGAPVQVADVDGRVEEHGEPPDPCAVYREEEEGEEGEEEEKELDIEFGGGEFGDGGRGVQELY